MFGLTQSVYCHADGLRHRVERLVSMMRTTSQSLSDSFHLIPPSSTMLFQGKHSEVELDEKIRTIDSDTS